MERSPFLPLPEGMLIDRIEQTDSQLTVTVISTRADAACPGCGCPSEHVHSQYHRTVNDVPCGGRNVVLRLGVRKFFCLTLTCQRKVFGSAASRSGPHLCTGEQSPSGGTQSHWARSRGLGE